MLSISKEDTVKFHTLPAQPIRMTHNTFDVMDHYKDAVYRTALTVTGNFADAEDIMQDVFLQYYQSHPDFESPAHEKAWLLRCTINAGRNLRRSAWFSRRIDADIDQFSKEAGEDASDVLAAVLSLPEQYRTAIYLHYYEGYPIKEIARLTNSSEAAVGKRLSRARDKLRQKLGGDLV